MNVLHRQLPHLWKRTRASLAVLLLFLPLLLTPGACSATPAQKEVPLYRDLLFKEKEKQTATPRHPAETHEKRQQEMLAENKATAKRGDDSDPLPELPDTEEKRTWGSFLRGMNSESVGRASRGELRNGRFLPEKGSGYKRKNDKAPYGTDETVAILLWACHKMTRLYPGTVPVVMGDLSDENGGRLRPHASHQSGRDADVGYYFKDNRPVRHFMTANRKNLDVEKTWTFVELLLSTQKVQYLFIDRRIQRYLYREASQRGWTEDELSKLFEAPLGRRKKGGIIRHIRGHRHHLHVRFYCPEGDKQCR